jgi:F0F1-type ATP synthase membrane subunit a
MQFIQTAHAATTEGHVGPHIPSLMGDPTGLFIAGIPVTTTILSTWLFMIVLFVGVAFFYQAAKAKKANKLQAIGIDVIKRLDALFSEAMESHELSRKFLWLVWGFFIFIFLGNIFGLMLDVIGIVMPAALGYIRPINSDINTTLVLGLTIIMVAQATGIYMKGFVRQYGHYIFNFHGDNLMEKCISVFVGWLHFIGEFVRVISLSTRLFLNIFMGVVIISIVVYLGNSVPYTAGIFEIFTFPFWLFELFVAFLQSYIFLKLSGMYLYESVEETH